MQSSDQSETVSFSLQLNGFQLSSMAENPILIDEEEKDKEKSPPPPTTPLCEKPTRSPIQMEKQLLRQKRGTYGKFTYIGSLYRLFFKN